MYARIVGSIGLLIALPALALWLVEALGNTVLDFGLPVTTGSGSGTVRGIGPYPRETWHLDWIGLDGVSLNSDQVAVFVAAADRRDRARGWSSATRASGWRCARW